MRDITAIADVNPSLVSRYFGSKDKLFAAALEDALGDGELLRGERSGYGRRITDFFARQVIEDEIHPLPMLVFAAIEPTVRDLAFELLTVRVVEPLKVWFGAAEAEERAAQILLVTAGFFIYRHLYPLPSLQGELSPAMRRWLETELQAIVDGGR